MHHLDKRTTGPRLKDFAPLQQTTHQWTIPNAIFLREPSINLKCEREYMHFGNVRSTDHSPPPKDRNQQQQQQLRVAIRYFKSSIFQREPFPMVQLTKAGECGTAFVLVQCLFHRFTLATDIRVRTTPGVTAREWSTRRDHCEHQQCFTKKMLHFNWRGVLEIVTHPHVHFKITFYINWNT